MSSIPRASIGPVALLLAAHAAAQLGFPGLKQECQIGGPPPTISLDTPTPSIANSFNWIVQVCNSQIGVFERNGVRRWFNTLGGNPFTFGGCVNQNTDSFFGSNPLGLNATRIVDTKVLYDRINDRFCVIGMQQDSPNASGAQGLFVAWSNNDNPMPSGTCPGGGGWRIWRTPVPNVGGGIPYQPDFNGMGQTEYHVVYSGILQPISTVQPPPPSYTFFRYFRKTDLSAMPQPNPLPYREIVVQRPTWQFAHAADSFDAGTNIYLVAVENASALRVTCVNLGNDTEINTLVPVTAFIPAGGGAGNSGAAPQPVGALDTIDGRMQSVVQRDGSLYCCHTVMSGSGIGARHVVRWYQIALNTWPMVGGVPQVFQTGTIDLGGGVHAFMPAIAVNSAGTVVVTYARSSATEAPGVGWSGRRSFDLPGTMPQGGNGPGGIPRPGLSSYTSSQGVGGNPNIDRWGDWSSAVLDTSLPTLRFLVCGSYAESSGTSCAPQQADHWKTWISTVVPTSAGQLVPFGTGFPGTNNVEPVLSLLQLPRIGSNPPVNVTNTAGANTLGLGLISLAELPPPGVPSGFGPVIWVDMNQGTSVTFSLDAVSGQFPLSIPYNPAFIGVPLFLQAGVFDNGAAQGLAATQGWRVFVGS
jgi:hypothetical protein